MLLAPFLFLLNSSLHLLVPFPRGEAYLEQAWIHPSNKSICSLLVSSVIILSGTKAQFRSLNPTDNEIEADKLLFLMQLFPRKTYKCEKIIQSQWFSLIIITVRHTHRKRSLLHLVTFTLLLHVYKYCSHV